MAPIGRDIADTAKVLNREFSNALREAGGSLPTWLILLELKQARRRSQQDLAAAVGIEAPTLTRHLDGLEERGLVARRRQAEDRRTIQVELTGEGEAAFRALRQRAAAFDRKLRQDFSEAELEQLRHLLSRLRQNAGGGDA